MRKLHSIKYNNYTRLMNIPLCSIELCNTLHHTLLNMTDSASQRSDGQLLAGGNLNSKLYRYYRRRNPEEFSITRFWCGNFLSRSLRQLGVRRYAPSSVATPGRGVSTKETDFNFGVSLTRVVMITSCQYARPAIAHPPCAEPS